MQQGTGRNGWAGRSTFPRTGVMVAMAALLGVLGFLGAGSIAGAATHTNATVSLRKTTLGSILVSSSGHTLYMFTKDRSGKSACAGGCAQFWPPLIAHGKPRAGAGIKPALLGTTKRSDGRLQVTYKKHPLYTFAPDKQAGQVTGQGSAASWYVMSAGGAAIVKALPATTTAPGTTTTTTGETTTTPGATTAPDTTTTTTTGTTTTTQPMTNPYDY